jgi:hypothetical protein
MRRARAFTLVEVLVVVLLIVVLMGLVDGLLPCTWGRARESARRSSCGNNVGNMIKCCHLYSDVVTNLGMFPMYGTDSNANGLKSLNLLYNAYIKDYRTFSCPSASTQTTTIPAYTGDQTTMTAWMTPQHTKYGYDPGHKPAHATVGVVADFSDDPTKNSSNHGADRPGQNVATGAGDVRWRGGKDGPGGIYTNEGAPDELETFIIQ